MPRGPLDPDVVVGPEPMAPSIVAVEADTRRALRVTFETGEVRRFDVSPLVGRGVFRTLEDRGAFEAVRIVEGGGGVAWASGPDLSAGRLHSGGTPLDA